MKNNVNDIKNIIFEADEGIATIEYLNDSEPRKTKTKNRTRNKNFALKFTEKEIEEIDSKIKKSGLSKTDFILKCVREKEIIIVDDLMPTLAEVRRQGFNINQIAHAMNSYACTLRELKLEVYDGEAEWNRLSLELEKVREENVKTLEVLNSILNKVV